MSKQPLVTLTKISGQDPTGLPNGYWLSGRLLSPVSKGNTILVHRTKRMGRAKGEAASVAVEGIFQSTVVTEIGDDGTVTTENSVWKVAYENSVGT